MESLQTVLFVIQIIVSAFLILIVLAQKSGEDALGGIGGGASNKGLMPHKMVANTLTKITMTLFTLFMINSLLLATISARNVNKNKSLIEQYIEKDNQGKGTDKSSIEIPEAK
jgi:protein translocase SecG subunit